MNKNGQVGALAGVGRTPNIGMPCHRQAARATPIALAMALIGASAQAQVTIDAEPELAVQQVIASAAPSIRSELSNAHLIAWLKLL